MSYCANTDLVTNLEIRRTENIMTSNTNMAAPIRSVSQPRRRNPFTKLSSAARHPMRKELCFNKFYSDEGSFRSTATETTQVTKCVRFSSEKTRIRKTLSRKDYTLEESKASWLSHEDGQIISRQCCKEIKKIDDGKKLKDKKYCARGLEGQTGIGLVSKARKRALAINAVLDEQSTQWEQGVFDEDTIAVVYYRASSICQLEASLVGRRDHRAAEEIHGSSYEQSSARHYHHHEQTAKAPTTGSNKASRTGRRRN
jgi:hypothetical protein